MKRTFPSWKMLREVSSPFISPRARGCRTSGGCGERATWRCWLRPGSRLTTCSCWTPSWCSATSPPSCSRGGLVHMQFYNHLWLLQIQIQISNKVERFPNRRCARQRGSEHHQVHGTHRTIMVDNQIHINDQFWQFLMMIFQDVQSAEPVLSPYHPHDQVQYRAWSVAPSAVDMHGLSVPFWKQGVAARPRPQKHPRRHLLRVSKMLSKISRLRARSDESVLLWPAEVSPLSPWSVTAGATPSSWAWSARVTSAAAAAPCSTNAASPTCRARRGSARPTPTSWWRVRCGGRAASRSRSSSTGNGANEILRNTISGEGTYQANKHCLHNWNCDVCLQVSLSVNAKSIWFFGG